MTSPPPDPRPRRTTTTDPTRKVTRRDVGERSATHRAATTRPQNQPPTKPSRAFVVAFRRFLHGAVFDNASIKLVALVLAITIFILVNTEKDAVIGVNVGVSYTMPDDRVLVSEPVDQVRITVRGSWRRIKRFDEREIERIHLQLTNMRSGEFVFQEDMLRLPPGLELLSINPATMHLQFEKRISKSVPVSIKTVGDPVRGYEVERMTANPSHVSVRGAESVVAAITEVRTVRVVLDNRRESFRERVALVAPEQFAEIVDNAQVDVDISVVEELDKRVIGPLPVAIRAGAGSVEQLEGFTTEPAEVMVVLHGSRVAIEQVLKDGVVPYVKVFPADLVAKNRVIEVWVDVEGVGPEVKPREVALKRR